jgi:hypothetical protein
MDSILIAAGRYGAVAASWVLETLDFSNCLLRVQTV